MAIDGKSSDIYSVYTINTNEVIMVVYSSTELRIDSSRVFNEVQKSKEVEIVNRTRPTLVLILKDHLDHLKEQAAKNGG